MTRSQTISYDLDANRMMVRRPFHAVQAEIWRAWSQINPLHDWQLVPFSSEVAFDSVDEHGPAILIVTLSFDNTADLRKLAASGFELGFSKALDSIEELLQ